jgi:hypothetical protein
MQQRTAAAQYAIKYAVKLNKNSFRDRKKKKKEGAASR